MIYLVGISCFVLLSAWIDYEHLKDNDYIESHTSRSLIRILFIVCFSRLDVYPLIGMSLFFASTFDNTLNIMRKKELFTLGNTAYWDRFWIRIKPVYILLTLLSIPVSIFILLKQY